jgi:hypothetical protein
MINESARPETPIDPEPLAVVTVCIGAVMFVNAVANTFINYKKLLRDDENRLSDAEIEFLIRADTLRSAGERLLNVIVLVSQSGETAFSMTARESAYKREEGPEVLKREAITLRSGETSIELHYEERPRWNQLVGESAKHVEVMNEAVEKYEDALSSILAAGQTLNSITGLGVESIIDNVVDRSIEFQKALDSYHTLRASSPVEEAQRRFSRVMYAARAMVEAANGFAQLSRVFYELQHKPS